ncbi:cytochrome c oxidase assembly protein [Gracilibacillus oryzae]|uniref:cytochrome c oxidase assembly protein n=1 Tax=Gracilibacillus oryzae TaxID=1672701 RepID=UPI002B1BD446|nr:cytochrome c oxidase assembly protein [Gracilibacillus oryzae]
MAHHHHPLPNELNHTNFFDLLSQILLSLPFFIGIFLYVAAIIHSRKKSREWPVYRTVCWMLGSLLAIVAVTGPLADKAMLSFSLHMVVHLMLGMIAPLLMVVGAPVTLFLRALSVKNAKLLTKILRSTPVKVITDPFIAALLNIGGLWILYTTDLYHLMHEDILLHIIIHLHVFLAGYVYTLSIIYMEPLSHRTSYLYRSIIMIL